ncbi:MAG: ABC transporter permease [Pseudomonadota bacterium]
MTDVADNVTIDKAAAANAAADVEPSHGSLWQDVWKQYKTHRGAMVGTIIFVLITLGVVIGPFIHTIEPNYIDIRAKNQGPSFEHPMGTDQLGRDTLAQVLAGGRISMAVGVTAMLLALVVGTLIGVLAGYFKKIDGLLMRFTDLFLALPLLPLLLVIIMLFRDTLRANFGPETGIFILIVFVIGMTSWMQTARIVRGDVLALKEREFVMAAKSIGTGESRIISRHIFPNILSPIMVSATLGIASAIITESALSFLGLGFPSDFPTWGRLVFDGVTYLEQYPSRVLWPGLAISLTVLSVNYMGDGLRDALDPRIRGR